MFYHATKLKFLKNIQKNGLLIENSKSTQKAVYLSDCSSTASNYSYQDDEKWILLTIDSKLLDSNQFSPDDYELKDYMRSIEDEDLSEYLSWEEVPWELSIEKCNQVAYLKNIPFHFIKDISIIG